MTPEVLSPHRAMRRDMEAQALEHSFLYVYLTGFFSGVALSLGLLFLLLLLHVL